MMNEGDTPDTESLLDEGTYQQILREDSLLSRMDSSCFRTLIDPTPPPPQYTTDNMIITQQQQHQQLQLQEQQASYHHLQQHQHLPLQESQEAPDFNTVIQTTLDLANSPPLHCLDVVGQDDHLFDLSRVEETAAVYDDGSNPSTSGGGGGGGSVMAPDSTPSGSHHVPSMQVYPGQYNFSVSLPGGNKDRNKWCFSALVNKLYLCDLITVPIEVRLREWTEPSSITITPVFKDSRHRLDPVIPCYNCKNQQKTESDHIVVVEGQECEYRQVNERHFVCVPVYPPPPGEECSTILIKLTCRTSCVGGPNRRPFCLVFTLHDRSGGVIGRQVLDLKCCKCPFRDMGHEENALLKRQEQQQQQQQPSTQPAAFQPTPAPPIQTVNHENINTEYIPNEQTKRSKQPVRPTKDRKKKRFLVKVEPDEGNRKRTLYVEEHLYKKVQAYYNSLLAEEMINKTLPDFLYYSD